MTADDLMRLVNRYTEACDDLGAGLFNQTEAETNAKHAKAKELHGQILAEVYRLHAEAAKSERRAIAFGDIVNSQVVAMRAALVAGKLEGLDEGMQWIANTLCGPGHLPDLEEARALGGAQALWDKETAEHEAFRAAHPGPEAPPAVVPGEHRKAMLLCQNCHRRFHTEDVSGHHSDSTH